jgi:TRAP-type C4-dicarboxylate transport system substrate-binding protein
VKKIFLILVSAVLFSALILGGCSKSAPAPAPEPVKEMEPIILSVAPANIPPPPGLSLTTVVAEMANLVEERTNGRVKWDIYWGQTLAPVTEQVSALNSGIADIAIPNPDKEPGKIPLSVVGHLPGIGSDMQSRAKAYWDLCNQEPEISELAQYKIRPLATILTPEQSIISRVPIRSLADLKGKKISTSGIIAETLAELGAVPLAMAPPEQYESMQRGTIDGIAVPLGAVGSFKFYEVGKYFTRYELGNRLYPMGINQDVWNRLPADIQKILVDLVPDFDEVAYQYSIVDSERVDMELMQENKVEIIEPSAEDKAAIKEVQSGQADKWAADQEKAGLPGEKILSDFRKLVEKYEK